jgi:hypothetical protein
MEYAFSQLPLIQQMQEQQRSALCYRLLDGGALPLLVQALQPGQPLMSFAMTLTGVLFKGWHWGWGWLRPR